MGREKLEKQNKKNCHSESIESVSVYVHACLSVCVCVHAHTCR